MIAPEHDHFHDPGEDPYWNESALFMFQAPQHNLSGFCYFYHRPNMNYSVGGVAFWNGDGEGVHDCLYHDWARQVPFPRGGDIFDFTLENGLTVSCKEHYRNYHVSYHADGCDLELDWEAVRDPHASGLPQKGAVWGAGRYEQVGRAIGTVTVDDGSFDIDSWSCRDRSWGSRKWAKNPRTHWAWAVASPDSGFQVLGFSPLDPADDPVEGTADKVVTGWYVRDGVEHSLVSGERTVERSADGRPVRTTVVATDDAGRILEAVGVAQNYLLWNGYPHLTEWWSRTTWTFDGHEAHGEDHDIYPNQELRRFLRRRRKRA